MVRFENVLVREKPYCVYYHEINGVVFYIGSGVLARAFEHGFARRNEAWNIYVDMNGPDVTVRIAHYCRERAEARRVEYKRIKLARPLANLPYDPSLALEWQVKNVEDFGHVATDAYEGKAIRMDPDGTIFRSLTEAHRCTGISKSAICNSCSGKYPIVQGKQFCRVPRPERSAIIPNWRGS
jgi:hypothetical protein